MKDTSKMLIALGAGLAIGGILGVLFAPDKGSVTRNKIAESPKKFADTVRERVKMGKEKLGEVFNRTNSEVEEPA
jgi:gas vesicle protein